jgi:hypothetical protein
MEEDSGRKQKPRPKVISIISKVIYRLALRSKAFERIRELVSNRKKTLEFETKRAAVEKADEMTTRFQLETGTDQTPGRNQDRGDFDREG